MLFIGYSRRTLTAFSLALFIHLVLLVALIVSWGWSSRFQSAKHESALIIQATVVNRDRLSAKAEQQQEITQEILVKKPEKAKPNKVVTQHQQQVAAEQARQEDRREREQKRRQEQARLKRLEAQRKAEAEARRKAEAKKKRIAEQKRRAEAKKRRLEEQRRQAEARRKAEAERQRREAARRKAEAERQRQEAARRRAEAERRRREQELQARIEAAQKAERERHIKAALNQFSQQIQSQVRRGWIRPPGTRDDLVVVLQVELLSSGEVQDVIVVQSSGNRTFDRSAQAAVYRAAPLPIPDNPAAVEQLLPRFNFKFIPGG